jgi:predicted TIM-barrel fold metal-dependent hydrolase
MACFSLIMSEVPRVFPDLRWGFIESSAQWVPWIVNETIRRSGATGQRIPRNPLNEFKIYITAQTDDDFPFIFKYAGEDNIIIGTDYGHTDASSEIDAISVFKGLKDVSDLAKQKVLSDNPRALFSL